MSAKPSTESPLPWIAVAARRGPVALIQFDAHQDTWPVATGADGQPRVDHGSFVKAAVDAGLIDLDPAGDSHFGADQGLQVTRLGHAGAPGVKRSSMMAANRAGSMFPPDRTMAVVRPAVSTLPASKAASDTAPPGSTTSFRVRKA